MKKCLKLLAVLAICLTFGLTYAADINNEGFIEVEGIVYYDPNAVPRQTPNDMRRVAIMEAYRYIAEEVGEVHVTSDSTVNKSCRESDIVSTNVKALLSGLKVYSVTRNPDGSFSAIVRMPVYGSQGSLASAVLPQHTQIEELPPTKLTNIESFSSKNYTGLIIDCRGKKLETAIAPSIKSTDGLKIYSYEQVSSQTAIDKGMVEYTNNIDSVSRAGSNPLKIKAADISNKCDIVISQDDANIILAANQSTRFLNNCMVVIVR